jgi:hypothetical protein
MSVLAGGDFSDPTNERIIYLSAAGLAILGALLLIGTIMWWRRGRTEHPVLAPLEVMSERGWIKSPDTDRRRRLEQVRLSGAGAIVDEPVRAEPVDLGALVRNAPQAFDDLRDPEDIVVKDVVETPPELSDLGVEDVAVEDVAVEDVAVEDVAVEDVGFEIESAPNAAPVDATSAASSPYDEFADLLDSQPSSDAEASSTGVADLEGLEAMASSPNDPLL